MKAFTNRYKVISINLANILSGATYNFKFYQEISRRSRYLVNMRGIESISFNISTDQYIACVNTMKIQSGQAEHNFYYFRCYAESYFIMFDRCICSFQKHLQLIFRLIHTTKVKLQLRFNSLLLDTFKWKFIENIVYFAICIS